MFSPRLIALLLLCISILAQTQGPIIYYVSNSPSIISTPIYSSLYGGKLIYIKAIGHNPTASDNQVYVGTMPCIIPSDGVTDTFISCETTSLNYPGPGLAPDVYNLPVTLISYGAAFTTVYPYVVHYTSGSTPQLNQIFPTAGQANFNVYLSGLHRITNLGDGRDMGDVVKLKLGNDLCSRFDVVQDPIYSYYIQSIQCIQSSLQEAGKYNISEQLTPGFAYNSPALRRSSLVKGEYFEFTSLPVVASFTPVSGNLGGQFIKITGTGFSVKNSNNKVLVDGNDCAVTSSSQTQISCTLANRDIAKTKILSTNSSSQQNGYFSGSGLQYARYSYSASFSSFVTAVKAKNTTALGQPLQVGIRTQLREGDFHGSYYGQTWKGYFTAPVTGNYTFRGQSDDFFSVYLATTYGSTELPSAPLIYTNNYFWAWNNFYVTDVATAQAWILLEAGKSYYLQAYHMNYAGSGNFNVEVDVPNNDSSLPFQAYEVDKIMMNSTVQPQLKVFTLEGGIIGQVLNLRIYRTDSSGSVTYDVNQNVTYGCSASNFQNILNNFNSYYGYTTTVTRNIYDSSNNTINTTTGAVRFQYIASIYQLRSAQLQAETFRVTVNNFTGTFKEVQTQTHSPLINGTWTLKIGGNTINPYNNVSIPLPYNIDPSILQNGIRLINGLQKTQVSTYAPGGYGAEYSYIWIIYYKGYNGVVPNVQVNGAGLTGGSTTPTIQRTVRRPYSTAITFGVDYRFLNTYSNSPSLSVIVNDISSICLKNCSYTFKDLSKITSLSLSGSTLSLAISDPTSLNFTASTVKIKVGGLPCTISNASTIGSITCALQTNTDGSPILVAGLVTPQVFIDPYGIVPLDGGVNPINVPLNANSLSVTTGGNNGGYILILSGSGFSLDKSQVTIQICGNFATIRTLTNEAITFYMPACSTTGSKPLNLTVGTITSTTLSFLFTDGLTTAPVIYSISAASSNPAIKSTLQINGNGFGNVSSQVNVFLSNATGKIYKLRVITVNNTYIKVGLSGGLAGDYTVQVNMPNTTGDSVVNSTGSDQFSYLFTIDSITPHSGSLNGGTLLTITGQNFSPATSDTLVYVGDTLNWFCAIESITTTQIKCRTPSISSEYSIGQNVKVVISTKLIVLNTCTGNCNFTYIEVSSSPNLTSISLTTANVQNVTLTGTNFTQNSSCQVSLTNKDTGVIIVTDALQCTDTAAIFTVLANFTGGNYFVKIRNSIGQSNSLSLTISWNIGSASYASGGSSAGNIVSWTGGSGYPDVLGGSFQITITSGTISYPVKVISCCAGNNLTLELPPATSTLSITFKTRFNPTSPNTKTYLIQTTKTPIASLISPNVIAQGVNTVTINRTSTVTSLITNISLVSTIDNSQQIKIGNWTINGTQTTFTVNLNAGPYKIKVLSAYGYYQITDIIKVNLPTNIITTNQISSFLGGSFTIQGTNLSPSSYITVNGFKGLITSYSNNQATYNVPPLITQSSQAALSLSSNTLINMGLLSYFSDQNASVSNVSYVFDGSVTTIYGSPNTECYIGMDVGSGLAASINRIRFFPYLAWANTANYTLYSKFQGSNDRTTWTTFGIIDQTVHSGYNTIMSLSSTPFRYIRFLHSSTSQCNLAQIQLYGIVYSSTTASLTSQLSSVIYHDGSNDQTFTNAIQYRQDHTPIIQSVYPPYGDVFGGYDITINGQNLGFDVPVITIDGVDCVPSGNSSTQINCTVGARPNIPKTNTFIVHVGGMVAIIRNSFLYVLKWSDQRTWGVDLPPIDDDLVYVPPGMTLLVDQDTPILKGIAVQNGTLLFSNDTDVTVRAGFITLVGGRFLAGTDSTPLHSKLTFIMYGDYYGKQQPMLGNKGIGCMQCKFSMHGIPRTPTWTTIAATIVPGATSFTVSEDVDWKAGEEIVVAATGFFHYEAEQRTIASISGRVITVAQPFVYKHISQVESYGISDKLVMRAEVGLLTRNIKMMGDPTSVVGKYGSHLMLAGKAINGLEGHVAYAQFTHCGQPQILGRYCIHFHMNGEVPTSYVRGNAVHESFARVVTIHAVHLLLVQNNVGYRVRGHNFFVQDGIQTKNIIRNNLAISSLTVTNMLQTDISVASFWITNPTNDFTGNHAAGGDFYGIWYEIKANPDGPSATNDVCPIGNPLGLVANNVAHSNIRFGLRIFKLYSRTYPCMDVRNDSNADDPWSQNPSIPSLFSNFTIYKNLQDGVLSEQSGNIIFKNFTIAQNYHGGVQFYFANFTKQPVVVIDSVIIGKSKTNAQTDTSNYTSGMGGIITPRTGSTNLTNIRFYNYPVGSIAVITCSKCDDKMLFTNVGTQIFVKQINFDQVIGNFLLMLGPKRDIIYDTDASLAPSFDGLTRTSGTIIHNYTHIALYHNDKCPQANNVAGWDNAIMCNQDITIRRIMITNLADPYIFNAQYMKVMPIDSQGLVIDPNTTNLEYTSITSRYLEKQPKVEKPATWSLPYITGQKYAVWWGTGLDFSHLSISSTPLFKASDLGVVFKFNYTYNRELYRVGPMRGGGPLNPLNYLSQSSSYLDVSNCSNGAYYHNNEDSSLRMFTVCQSGKNKSQFQYTDVNAVICQFLCPAPAGTFIKQGFIRLWSNATQWPNSTVPKSGDNVTINGNWTIMLDIDPAPIGYFVVDGTIVSDDTRDVNITAKSIHIRAGNISAGNPSTPFQHKFTIQINGLKQDHGYYIDPIIAGNKYFVVTGSLNLYGKQPTTVSTHLTQTAFKNTNTIYVATSSDWAVGDSLALSPSFSNPLQFETVKITAINTDGSITVSPALQYTHYGAASITINHAYGSLDTRTQVGHLNRNIQIVPGPDDGWGFTIITYGFLDGDIRRDGSVDLIGVELLNGGQYDTKNSPLVFLNTKNSNFTSHIVGSSFVNCKAWCVNVQNSHHITFTNNVFYNGWVFGLQAVKIQNFQFNSNLIIGITQRPTMTFGSQLVACVGTYQYINPTTDNVSISNNYCLGSQGHGFALPHIKCNEINTHTLGNNTAGSCQIGFIFNQVDGDCQAFSWIKAFACEIGQIGGPPSKLQLIYSNFILADNQRGATLKFGAAQNGRNHSGYFYNSYITAISRPTCTQCYGSSATICSNNIGMRLLTVSANGQILPGKFGTGYDVVCKQEVFDHSAYLYNIIFDSFNKTYIPTAIATACSNNYVFRANGGAFDSTSDHNLFNCSCTGCDTDSYVLADKNSENQLGWFGGCGDILCTGMQNYLIHDFNGTFLPYKGVIIPNNPTIGNNQAGCTASTHMNAHICNRQDFATLQYQSIAPDFNTRIMWPVNLTADGANYYTLTNGFREWDWSGKQPLNHRFGRFVSIVKLQTVYNTTYTAQPPIDMQFVLRRRTPLGNPNNYVIIKMHYPLPNSIRAEVNGAIQPPILLTDSGLKRTLNTSLCGDNVYFYTNYTIHFVVTQDANCLVRILLLDSIQLTTHFAINASDFYTNTVMSSFISNLCALLAINDTSRVKIVGVVTGSIIVTTVIEPPAGSSSSSNSGMSAIASSLSAAINNGQLSTALSNATGSTMLGASSTFSVVQTAGTQTSNSSAGNVGMIIGIAIAASVVLIGVFVGFFYCLRKRAQIIEQIKQSEQQFHHQKDFDKDMQFGLHSQAKYNSSQMSNIKINQGEKVQEGQTIQLNNAIPKGMDQ